MSQTPLTPDTLRWLAGPEGARCLERASAFAPGDSLRAQAHLRADFAAHRCRAALALLEARRAAGDKFGERAAGLFGDREGVEMASRADVAALRAARFSDRGRVGDLGCGIGGDLLALAARGPVCGVDVNAARLAAARLNVDAANFGDRALLVRADAAEVGLRIDALFADPARRRQGRRVRAGAAYQPPLNALLERGRAVPAAAIKVAPGIRDADLPGDAEVEFVSAAGQCREGVIWLGEVAGPPRRATVLPGPHTLADDETSAPSSPVPVAPPGAVLYDPDAAVVRSHLVQALARRLDAWRLDPEVAYLSADGPPRPTPFARAFHIRDRQPFHRRRLQAYLRDAGLAVGDIRRRRFPVEADELRRLLGSGDQSPGRPVTLVFTRLDEKPTMLVCEAVS